MSLRLSRRTLLRGMLGGAAVSVGLPPLECLMNQNGTAYAGGQAFPKRFGVWFFGNGVLPDFWLPREVGPDYTLSPLLMPLAAHKPKLTLVSGTRVATINTGPHLSGPAGLFSGDAIQNNALAHATVDQRIAEVVGAETRFRSIETGIQPSSNSYSYSAPGQVNPPETSPFALYQRLFGEGFRAPGESTAPDPRLALRRSVLDAVGAQSQRLRGRLGSGDRQRLDQHLEGVRAIERQLQRLQENPPNLAACRRPEMPASDYPEQGGRLPVLERSRVMSDLMAMAMACDQTRVFFHMYSQPVNNVLFPNASAGHHQLTHDEPGAQPEVQAILRLIMADFGYFLSALDRVEEGDATLLDHALILCTTDCSYGRTHSLDEYPMLFAGSLGGAFRQGTHLRAMGENASKVMLTVLQLLGVRANEYGVGPGRVTDGLGGLVA